MNVLFVDIDGVLNSVSTKGAIVDRMIAVLGYMCKMFDAKVVIESTHKPRKSDWEEECELILDLYNKLDEYEIELLGFTPEITIWKDHSEVSCFKDYEILYYLGQHPEIEHFAIIDDNDHYDLNILSDYLVETDNYVEGHPEEEGLLPYHVEEVGEILKKENIYKETHKKRARKKHIK